MPRFSVVIPTYNSGRYIVETIDSLRRQDADDWQLVIVDDGSTDGTVETVEGLGDARVTVHRQAHAGPAAARARGCLHCVGEWVIFLDHDDRLTDDLLGRYAAAIERHADAAVIYGDRVFIDEDGRRFGPRARRPLAAYPQGNVAYQALTAQFITTPGQACISAARLATVGGYPAVRGFGADWALWCLLATVGPFVFVGPKPVLEYRRHPGNMGMRALGRDDGRTEIDELRPSMEFVFTHARILGAFSANELRRCRRKREANCYRFKGTVGLRAGAWGFARQHLWQAWRRDPGSLANVAGLAIATIPAIRPFARRYLG